MNPTRFSDDNRMAEPGRQEAGRMGKVCSRDLGPLWNYTSVSVGFNSRLGQGLLQAWRRKQYPVVQEV